MVVVVVVVVVIFVVSGGENFDCLQERREIKRDQGYPHAFLRENSRVLVCFAGELLW